MFRVSAFIFDTHRELFAKAQKRFADCFVRQIVADSRPAQLLLDPLHSVVLVSAYYNLLILFIIILFCTLTKYCVIMMSQQSW